MITGENKMSLLKAKEISISFGGLMALNDISFDVNKGEIFSIVGPNGSGKTTIFNCINRYYDLDKGTFIFDDMDIANISPHLVAGLGIARTFQNIELSMLKSVIDNILLGQHNHGRSNIFKEILFTGSVMRQEIENREKADKIITFLGLQAYRDHFVISLPYGIQKRVELARALAMEPKLLLLDEPSAGMNMEESKKLDRWITEINEAFGITLIIIEHNMKLVRDISDRVMVLNFGEKIVLDTPEEVMKHPEVIKAYLGDRGANA